MTEAVDSPFTEWRAAIDQELAGIPDPAFDLPSALRDAIRYSVSGGGKRLRGLLFLAAYDAVGGTGDAAGIAAAIEIVHAYSLVHDDLPCMDNDSLRRGMPTTHRAHGVAVATLAGVAMVPIAVHQALQGCRRVGLDDATSGRIVAHLMAASGAGGMVGGQLLDLMAENARLGMDELERVHRGKTGALLTAAFVTAGIAGGAAPGALEALTDAGDGLGLAFQIADDVLDATATSAALGKTAGSDAAMSKSTYVSLLGVEEARRRAASLIDDAMRRLDEHALRTTHLERLARFIAARRS